MQQFLLTICIASNLVISGHGGIYYNCGAFYILKHKICLSPVSGDRRGNNYNLTMYLCIYFLYFCLSSFRTRLVGMIRSWHDKIKKMVYLWDIDKQKNGSCEMNKVLSNVIHHENKTNKQTKTTTERGYPKHFFNIKIEIKK